MKDSVTTNEPLIELQIHDLTGQEKNSIVDLTITIKDKGYELYISTRADGEIYEQSISLQPNAARAIADFIIYSQQGIFK